MIVLLLALIMPLAGASAQVIDSIAILPFENRSGDPELEYVSDGRALLPHPIIADWIREQAEDCFGRMGIDHLPEEPQEKAEISDPEIPEMISR